MSAPARGDVVIGIDAGTSVIKSVAFTLAGEPVAQAALPNTYRNEGGEAEQDIARTWTDTAHTLRQLVEATPDLAARVAAVAVTGQGDGTWLIDRAGEPVGPALLWLDARSAAIVERVRADDADVERFRITGTGLGTAQQGPQLAWLKQHQPERLAQAAAALHCKDWLHFKLTGRRATDPSEVVLSFGDFRTGAYSDTAIAILGIQDLKRLMPDIIDGARVTTPLSPEAARETGLRAGTPVALGYIDIACSALGTGLLDRRPGTGVSILGSTGMHIRLARRVEDVRLNPERTGYTMPFPASGMIAQTQSTLAATLNIDWLVELATGVLAMAGIAGERREIIAKLESLASAAPPDTLVFHPYISEAGERGPFIDPHARAGFYGLSQRHGWPDLVRAVFEGLCLGARDCYRAFGEMPREIRVSGGAARSATLRAMLAAALDVPVRASRREEAGAAGAAMMAAVTLGAYPDMERCAAAWIDPLLEAPEPPDAAAVRRYDTLFAAYASAREHMRPVWRQLASP
jgi:erythritol kinase